jgi:hypothetical protein
MIALLVGAFNGAAALAKDPPSDICSLLLPTQLEKTLGQPFGAAQKSTAPAPFAGQPSGTECDFPAQKGPAVKVVFIAYVDPSAPDAKQTFDRLAAWYTPKSKPAVGDAAYIDSKGAIHVLKGRVRYYIGIAPMGTSKAAPFVPWLSGQHSDTPAKDDQLKDLAAGVAAQL